MSKRVFDFIPGVESDEIDGNVIESALVITKSDDYTITDTDGGGTFIQTGADKTFTLPTAADNTDRKLSFVNAGSGYLDIAAEGSENINDTLSSYRLNNQYFGTTFYCDGTGWYIFEKINSMLTLSNKTADYTITASEAKGIYVFTNAGATDKVEFTLPAAVPGYRIDLINIADYNTIIVSASGDKLFSPVFSGSIRAQNSSLTSVTNIYSIDDTNWYIKSTNTGYWTDATRGLFGGGATSSDRVNVVEYFTVSSTSNYTDFGDLSEARHYLASCASLTRALFGGGNSTGGFTVKTVEFFTVSNAGNYTDFGDLSDQKDSLTACSNSTIALFGGGDVSSETDTVEYFTLSSEGDYTDFGDLSVAKADLASCASPTIALFGGGFVTGASGGYYDTVEYFTFSSASDYTDFGDLSVAKGFLASCSSLTRALFGGGSYTGTRLDTVEYFTFSSASDYTDFGDLSTVKNYLAACSSPTRALFGGGISSASYLNTVEYFTFSSASDYTDFGDLSAQKTALTACSNGHGGLL